MSQKLSQNCVAKLCRKLVSQNCLAKLSCKILFRKILFIFVLFFVQIWPGAFCIKQYGLNTCFISRVTTEKQRQNKMNKIKYNL